MPSQNLVSGVLTDESLNTNLAAIKQLESSMDFLISLSPEQRKRTAKLRANHVDFVHQMRAVCNQNPDFLPRQFDLAEFDRDVALSTQLEQVASAVTQLGQQIEDTILGVRSDMYVSALEVYGYLKVAREGDGLDVHSRELGRFFKKGSSDSSQDEDIITDIDTITGGLPGPAL